MKSDNKEALRVCHLGLCPPDCWAAGLGGSQLFISTGYKVCTCAMDSLRTCLTSGPTCSRSMDSVRL